MFCACLCRYNVQILISMCFLLGVSMRKKVDDRIRTLIQNGANARHRSLFVVIGDKGRDQVVDLHYLLSKAVVKARPTVLWCYSDRLEISSH
ncbi:unnamed protein product [Citrullus colocynthis]|uniref:Uncharacterized protein n=1 Tax=Citrullus colocynthis TaxID=252529 RepID=A0ABP0Z6D4_9ROSI